MGEKRSRVFLWGSRYVRYIGDDRRKLPFYDDLQKPHDKTAEKERKKLSDFLERILKRWVLDDLSVVVKCSLYYLQ